MAEPRVNATVEDPSGRVIARFSGAPTPLMLSQFPSDATGRARVETGTGTGSFRVRGLTAAKDLPLHTTANVPVVPNHVWIAAHRPVTFAGAGRGRIRVEKVLSSPFSQTFAGWASCTSLSVSQQVAPTWSPPSNAGAYTLKSGTLELYDSPDGTVVITLRRAGAGERVLFFSNESRGDWRRVMHHGEVIVDGWVKARDLVGVPARETVDKSVSRWLAPAPTRLAVQGEPRIVRSVSEVPIRADAKETDSPIGIIERGTETYVLDIVAGWASVIPTALNVVPASDGQFWVKATELGI